MKALPNWSKVHETFDGLVGSMKGQIFERI
jgi:hypothetical protein